MPALYIISAVIGTAALLYLIFIFAPSIVFYKKIFNKKSATPLDEIDISKTYFAPFEKEMRDAADRVESTYEMKRVGIEAYDGVTLYADLIDLGFDRTVAFFHGFSATPIINFGMHTERFIAEGYNVLLVYQRAHSVSGGEHCTLGLYESNDVLSWVNWFDGQENIKSVVLYGISMGATTIAYAAKDITSEKVKAIVLDCGYDTPWNQIARDCKRRHLPDFLLLPVINLFFRHGYKDDLRRSAAEALKKNRIPAFFLHGTADMTVDCRDSVLMHESCASEKKLLLAEGLHHTLAFSTGDDKLRKEVFDFLDKYTKGDLKK